MTRFGRRLSRDAAIYAAGAGVSLTISLASVAALTRLMQPAEFGELALLLLLAAFLTVIYNLGSLQGGLAWVFGTAGEEEVEQSGPAATATDKRRALGSALVLTLLVGLAGVGLAALAAEPLASGLLGDPDAAGLLVGAVACGGIGALWRLVSNVPRLERRPGRFVALSALRPLLVLVASVALVATGHGVGGALAGVGVGSALATGAGLVLIRESFRPALNGHHVKRIFALGAPFVPVIVAFWAIQNADLYVLSRFASDEQVGLYKLASRVGGVTSYFVSAFLMAWGPLTFTSAFAAAAREHGEVAVGARILSYYLILGFWLVLGFTLGADLLVRIAAPEYAGAAALVPLLAAGFVAYGTFVALYRAARFPRRRRGYVLLAVGAGVVFVVAVMVLTPAYGAYGTATAPIVSFVLASAAITWLSQRGPDPIPLEWGRLLAAALVAGACGTLASLAGAHLGGWAPPFEIAGVAAYPLLLVALGIVPAEHRRALREVVAGVLPRRLSCPDLASRLGRAAAPDRAALELIVRHGFSPARVSQEVSLPEEAVERRFVRALRAVAGAPGDGDDSAIARVLLSKAPAAERNDAERRLWDRGVDPSDIDQLESAYASLGAASRKLWRQPADGVRAPAR